MPLLILCVLVLLLRPHPVSAQDLEPRAFSPAPAGLNFALLGYGYSFGNVLLDPSLPVEDATAKVHTFVGAYVRTIDFFGMSGKVNVVVPFALGDWRGELAGVDTSTSRTGFGDPSIRLSVNFVGAPAMDLREFARYRQGTTVGASLAVIAPLGQYDGTKIVNLGSNRWTFKPRIGISQALGRWILEAMAAAWLFTDNPDALGATLEQDPLWALQGHVGFVFGRGAWVSADVGWSSGALVTADGVTSSERQENTRLGVTLAYPIAQRHSLKLAWTSGISSHLGADFDTVAIAYQHRWGGM